MELNFLLCHPFSRHEEIKDSSSKSSLKSGNDLKNIPGLDTAFEEGKNKESSDMYEFQISEESDISDSNVVLGLVKKLLSISLSLTHFIILDPISKKKQELWHVFRSF